MKRHSGLDHPVTFMPISFYVPPNGAGADYIAESNFRGFVAYGFRACWLGSGGDDPDEDCNLPRPVTREDVRHLRGGFLDYLERTIAMLWAGEIEKDGKTIDFGSNGESVDFEDDVDNDSVTADWDVTPQSDALMMSLCITGGDPSTIWMAYDAIKDRRNVLEVLREARQHVDDSEISSGLVSQVYEGPTEPCDDYKYRVEKIIRLVELLVSPDNLGEVASFPTGMVCLAGKDRLRDIVSLITVHDEIARNAKGDLWAEDAGNPRSEWRAASADGNTLLGYWDWVAKMREEQTDDESQ